MLCRRWDFISCGTYIHGQREASMPYSTLEQHDLIIFQFKILYAFLFSPIRVTRPAHLILLDLITPNNAYLVRQTNHETSSQPVFLQPPQHRVLKHPQLMWDKSHTHTKQQVQKTSFVQNILNFPNFKHTFSLIPRGWPRNHRIPANQPSVCSCRVLRIHTEWLPGHSVYNCGSRLAYLL